MKLLIDARPLVDPHSGGVRRVGVGLVQAICHLAKNDEITLLTTGLEKKEIPFPLPQNTKQLHIKWPNKILSAATLFGASIEIFFSEKYDAIFFPNLGFTGPLKTPYSILLHDLSFLIEPAWFSQKDRLWHKAVKPKTFIKNAACLFTVSEQTKTDLKNLMGEIKNTQTIPVAIHTLPQADSHVSDTPYFFAFGSNDKRKNTPCVIEAMEELIKEFDINLLVTGSNTWDKPFVQALGRINDRELAAYIKGAKALLYPSWYEGFGLPIHEAAALGTPVLASIAGALPETAPPGTRFIQPEKPHLWMTAMKSVLASPPKRARVLSEPSWDQAAQYILRHFTAGSH